MGLTIGLVVCSLILAFLGMTLVDSVFNFSTPMSIVIGLVILGGFGYLMTIFLMSLTNTKT